ncbi:hypothetical protein SAY87_027288 [Trapa incisa]|uniref:glucan endo-1,3-beta-D-glucosidase n=1 Tax=Trapa incisa TaxID=236973 RepID=A0AAN7GVV2_9MYRT|nr:hypothetical protein SAY87_027288 [Trapa incisa]
MARVCLAEFSHVKPTHPSKNRFPYPAFLRIKRSPLSLPSFLLPGEKRSKLFGKATHEMDHRAEWVLVFALGVCILGRSVEGLGVNWGRMAAHKLPPKTVVKMLKDNGIQKVKLFEVDTSTMDALAGSEIEVMVAIPNSDLATMNSYQSAKNWVKKNVTNYNVEGGVKIKYVAVGNQPLHKSYNNTFDKVTFPALKNIQNALNEAGRGDSVKATIPLNSDVYYTPPDRPVPSAGRFRKDIRGLMTLILEFLSKNNAPFTINIYPFLGVYANKNFPFNYAFFDGATPVVDNGIKYTNVFDANFDTLVSAMKAAGHENLTIMVGEVGWPTDGDVNANIRNAYRFYDGFLPKLAANIGTPLRPGSMEVYLLSLLDEDVKSIAPGDFERHWGLFRYDGQPKFAIDLSGMQQEKLLVPAQNVEYLRPKWCMLNPNAKDLSKLGENIKYACLYADCTSLGYGSSCHGLEPSGNASYAFNMFFQVKNQDPQSCGFQGLGTITTQNISQGRCNFTIQIAAGFSVAAGLTRLVVVCLQFAIVVALLAAT